MKEMGTTMRIGRRMGGTGEEGMTIIMEMGVEEMETEGMAMEMETDGAETRRMTRTTTTTCPI